MEAVPLDGMVTRLLSQSPFTYRVARTDEERATAYRLRARTVLARGWLTSAELPGGLETDAYDARARHVVGYDAGVPMCTGRVVVPPGLPTEDACGLVVEPAGRVVDVGRMCVAPDHQSREHTAFIGLMCALYLDMRAQGFAVACGMMSAPARSLVRLFGLSVDLLGPERTHWNEVRAPVRFSLLAGEEHVLRLPDVQESHPDGQSVPSTSTVLAPPNPNELDTA